MNPSSFFKEINSWQDFVGATARLDKKGKGDAFELLTKYFFLLNPRYSFYDNVWLWKDAPQKVLDDIGLPGQDLGIDLIAQSGEEYHAIQCKYHSDKHKAVTYREVSTFLSAIAKCDKISMGYICSSANVTSKNYDKVPKKLISKVLSDTWENLSEGFFNNLRTYVENKAVKLEVYKPLPHQKKAVDQAKSHFLKESRGKLIFPCGSGKSLTGFWITRELESKNTLIAVPSLSLIKQTLDVYLGQIVARKEKVKWLCICSDDSIGKSDDVVVLTEDIGVPCMTDPVYIERWLKDNKKQDKIIFTTYQSGKIIAEITTRLKLSFDVGIFDEAHKTVGSDKSLFSHLLFDKNIHVNKRVFMTATERFYAGSKDDIISMDDDDIYGETFAHMSFKEAINENLLTDYKIITIDIKKSEIAEFIKDNNLVQLSSKWKRETEARSLASMLALRKAMKRINIKNAVSFHSSIERAKRNKDLQKHITESYSYAPIDTYTVSGKMSTSKRNDIVIEFAKSPRALITNARCLTEGVDVPNIDCIVFADPRKSKVDIVQALGRALRKKDGKDWGYVILPVVYDGETNEIDNDNFNEIVSIVRGLAANDERIVEYFKDKSLGEGSKGKSGGLELFNVVSETLLESDLAEQLSIRVWEQLSSFGWMPFEEARDYVRTLKFKSSTEYYTAYRNGLLPKNLPAKPGSEYAYKNKGFISMPDFLGYDHKYQDWLPFEEAREYVRSFNLKSTVEWTEFKNSDKRLVRIPRVPARVYKNKGWISMGDWLGTGRVADHLREYMDFEKAKDLVSEMGFKSGREYYEAWKKGLLPKTLPAKPRRVYSKKGFVSMPDFLGIRSRFQDWMPFEEARDYVRRLGLKATPEYRDLFRKGLLPENLPGEPRRVYKNKGWISMGDFLGTGRVADQLREYRAFVKARRFVHKLKLKSHNEWKDYYRSGKLPKDIPTNPGNIYKNKGWNGIADWLGNSSNRYLNYVNFSEARKHARTLKLSSNKEWREYSKSNKKPKNIPASPARVYKNTGWNGWTDFLDNRKRWNYEKKVRPFSEAKLYAQKMKVKSAKEWMSLSKQKFLPKDLPSKPQNRYEEWKGWNDFLGKE